MEWVQSYVPDSGVGGLSDANDIQEKLKDGVVLCKLLNALTPYSIKKFNTSKMAFKQMENIGLALAAMENYGVSKIDLFQTVDLFEGQNMALVITTIHALGRKTGGKGKRGIGPKESQQNKREFSEEQLRAGEGVIGLQMGTNKFANQSGQNFGKTRAIID